MRVKLDAHDFGQVLPGSSERLENASVVLRRTYHDKRSHVQAEPPGNAEGRTRQDPLCPVQTAHRHSVLCHLANIASGLKRKLRYDPKVDRFVGLDEHLRGGRTSANDRRKTPCASSREFLRA